MMHRKPRFAVHCVIDIFQLMCYNRIAEVIA